MYNRAALYSLIFITVLLLSCAEEATEKTYFDIDKGSIIFTLYDFERVPINNAEISIKDSDKKANTDEKGIAIFERITEGKRTFIIRKFDMYKEAEYEIKDSIVINKEIFINHSFGKMVQIADANPFFIDMYEVSNEKVLKLYKDHKVKDDEMNLPAGSLNYLSAELYCKSINRRLCTREEFIKVCKTKNSYTYPYSNIYNPFKCNTNSSDLADVGSYKDCYSYWSYGDNNLQGRVYDMSGNASEWVKTDNKYYLMGGDHLSESTISKCESQIGPNSASIKASNFGFRCCRSIENN